ncbi:L-2,4-diaminobutyrate decarboxylase [Geothrix oryzae]|uniref:L-2,4-diaminobutyrate decarboxylase n=1 Tax=Geothrix oryzae TaxID=2927975 RepID=A0ABM8DSS7_9BACT|nr:aminotransferase class V-fold PLP-dependent enzyme [Geothrix oryzae]BDU70121.1 L-2,4-diaminobutyrate decarboxylase [Geothrix oryzae]
MLERLKDLEAQSRKLDPGAGERAPLWEAARQYGEGFLQALPESPAFVLKDRPGAGLAGFPIPEAERPFSQVLEALAEHVDGVGANGASGRHLAFIPPSSLFAGALGDLLAAITNRYAAYFFAGPGAVRMENQVISWLAREVGLPEGSSGNLAAGGSMAHLVGVCTAREAAGLKAADYPRACVYLSDQAHHCIVKALRVAGMDEAPVRSIPTDADFRLRPEALEAAIQEDLRAGLRPWLLVPTAGTTNTGAVDPLEACADLAQRHGLWMHTDGAYGASFALAESGRTALRGLERSDSLVLDPHKGLFTPLGLGVVLVRHLDPLRKAHAFRADYLPSPPEDLEELSPSETTLEFSKHARALRLWLPLQLHGAAAFRAALDEKLLLARYAHARLREMPGVDPGPEPQLSVLAFRFLPSAGEADAFNQALLQQLTAEGRIFLSGTRLNGAFYLRMAILAARTHREQVDEALERLQTAAAELA